MRAVLQRVSRASASVADRVVGRCGPGYLVLVGVHRSDTQRDAEKLAEKIATLRVLADAAGKMNLSLKDAPQLGPAQVLAVSNFTVYGDATSQRRPSFMDSAPYAHGEYLFIAFVTALRNLGIAVETGEFGADMQIESINDGPVTLVIDVGPG